jgi:hypothetical protein
MLYRVSASSVADDWILIVPVTVTALKSFLTLIGLLGITWTIWFWGGGGTWMQAPA